MSDNILKKLAAEMQELEDLFTDLEGIPKSGEDLFEELRKKREMLDKHQPGITWYTDAHEDIKKNPHDLDKLKEHLDTLDVVDDEDEDRAEEFKQEIVYFVKTLPRQQLYNLTSDLESTYRILYATLKSVDEDIRSNNLKDMMAKLKNLGDEMESLEDHIKSVREDFFSSLHDFESYIKNLH